MSEQWIKWEPISDLSEKYNLELISDTIEGFKLVLCDTNDNNKKIHVLFEDSIDIYRITDKNFSQNINQFWSFFKVINSEYALSVSKESYGLFTPEKFIHFVFATENAIIEILDYYEPKIELIK